MQVQYSPLLNLMASPLQLCMLINDYQCEKIKRSVIPASNCAPDDNKNSAEREQCGKKKSPFLESLSFACRSQMHYTSCFPSDLNLSYIAE